MVRKAAFTYDGLPISSGGAHKLRQKGFVSAFTELDRFVSAVSLDIRPFSVTLELFDTESKPDSRFVSLKPEFDRRFEKKWIRNIGEYTGTQWNVEAVQLRELVYELEPLRPIPDVGYAGPAVVVHVYWNLVLMDAGGQQLPCQTRDDYLQFKVDFQRFLGESFVYARVSESSTAHLYLSVPFENDTDEARQVVSRVQEHFPARLSSKHWKRWSLTKNGKSYLGRKVPGLI